MPPIEYLISVARLCAEVYQHTDTTENLDIVGMQDFSNGYDYGCAYISADTVYLVIAGTNDRADWLSNFKALSRADWYGINAHRGFVAGARALESQALELLGQYPEHNLVFAGHSRGGAIAILLAIAAEHHHRHRSSTCITFGQPRVSTGRQIELAYRFGKYVRVVNGADAVPRYPKIGYSHGGECLYIQHDGGCLIDPGQIKMATDRLFSFSNRGTDHGMREYIKELEQCAK